MQWILTCGSERSHWMRCASCRSLRARWESGWRPGVVSRSVVAPPGEYLRVHAPHVLACLRRTDCTERDLVDEQERHPRVRELRRKSTTHPTPRCRGHACFDCSAELP